MKTYQERFEEVVVSTCLLFIAFSTITISGYVLH